MQFETNDDNGGYNNYRSAGNADTNPRHRTGKKVKNVGIFIFIAGLFSAYFIGTSIAPFSEVLAWAVAITEILTSFCISVLFEGFGELINQASDTNKNLEDIKLYLYDRDNEQE